MQDLPLTSYMRNLWWCIIFSVFSAFVSTFEISQIQMMTVRWGKSDTRIRVESGIGNLTDSSRVQQWKNSNHYSDVIVGAITSQITSLTIVYSTVHSKKTSKLRVTGLCGGNSPLTGEFPAQRSSNAGNVSIWWSHHECLKTAGTFCNIGYPPETHLKLKSSLPITYFAAAWSFWEFAQSSTVTLICSVFKAIEQLKRMLWTNEFSRHLGLRWVPMLHSPQYSPHLGWYSKSSFLGAGYGPVRQ